MRFAICLCFESDMIVEESSVRDAIIKDTTFEKMKNIKLEFLDKDNKPLEAFIMTAKVDRDRDEIKSVELSKV